MNELLDTAVAAHGGLDRWNQVTSITFDGTLIEAHDDPERSFAGQRFETPWDDVHLAYFVGEAQWTYLNMPFLYTQPGARVAVRHRLPRRRRHRPPHHATGVRPRRPQPPAGRHRHGPDRHSGPLTRAGSPLKN